MIYYWIKIWFLLNQNMIFIESKYNFYWIKIWFLLNQNMIFIESKYDFYCIKIWFLVNQNMIFIQSRFANITISFRVESKCDYIIYFHSNYHQIVIKLSVDLYWCEDGISDERTLLTVIFTESAWQMRMGRSGAHWKLTHWVNWN